MEWIYNLIFTYQVLLPLIAIFLGAQDLGRRMLLLNLFVLVHKVERVCLSTLFCSIYIHELRCCDNQLVPRHVEYLKGHDSTR